MKRDRVCRYEAHDRQSAVTDARNGVTTYAYNNADGITSVTSPWPGNAQGQQVALTFYNSSLQATNVVQPDGSSVFSVYYPGGRPVRT